MNTARSPSRSNVSVTQAQSPPGRAKVVGKGQMDPSSISLSNPVRTTTNTATYGGSYTQQQQQQQQSRPAIKIRSPGSIATISSLRNTTTPTSLLRDTTHGARVSNGPSVVHSSSARSNAINNNRGSNRDVRRVGTGDIVRASASMVVGLGVAGVRGLQRDEGSVTSSDDGTISEDSVEDHIQLFSGAGGNHINSMPFRVSSRHTSSTLSFSGPRKVPTSGTGRIKVASSTVSSNSTASAAGKPRRMAAGASINAETLTVPSSNNVPIPTRSLSSSSSPRSSMVLTSETGVTATGSAVGLLSTSTSSSASSSSSLSWAGHNPPHRNDEVNSTLGANGYSLQPSPMPHSSSSGPQRHTSQPTIRTSKPLTTNAAAASKLAEENRRSEEAARTRRKIADLEISNASLLQINQTLEATIHKQATELQELKQRMMSSQFGGDMSLLPADLTTTLQDEDTLSTEATSTTPITATKTSTTTALTTLENALIIHEMTEADRQADLTFKRLCSTIEQMLFEAKQALDQSTKPTGVKVLSSFDMYEDDAVDDDIDTGDQSTVLDDDDDDIFSVDDDDCFSDPLLNPSPAMVY